MKFEEIWPGVSEEKSFKGLNGRTADDGQGVIPIAFCSGALKSKISLVKMATNYTKVDRVCRQNVVI